MLALLPLLTACNDFDTEFSVRSAESTVTVSSDGFARVSETFWVQGLIANNSGGVYVDIPQRFFDTDGSAQWRSFVLLAAKRGLDEEHYFLGHKLQGYSIYIGKNYFKRRRNRSLPPTVNKIGIEYRLGRLIREEGDKQILVLPAYMASVHDLRAEKKIVLTVPEGGTLRPSDKGANGYDIKSLRPNRFVISFAAGSGDRNPPDIEIAYPPATFPTTTVVDAAYWWISDNLLVFIGLAGPLAVLWLVSAKLWAIYRTVRSPLSRIDNKITDKTSPALAAFIYHDWQDSAFSPAFRASLCRLAIERRFRISGFDDDAVAVDWTQPKADRSAGRKKRGKSLGYSLNFLRTRLRKSASRNGLYRVSDAFGGMERRLRDEVDTEYKLRKGERVGAYGYTALFIAGTCASTIYLTGQLFFSLALFMFLSMVQGLAFRILRPSEVPTPLSEFARLKQEAGFALLAPLLIAFSLIYMFNNPPTIDERPYAILIGLHMVCILALSFIWRIPSAAHRRRNENVFLLRRYMLGQIVGPAMSVETYERYLPFSIALGVETAWTGAFDRWRADAGLASYEPDWLIKPIAWEA